jgi:hypothetical protein
MAGTFREREARVSLSHMAEVWLRLADKCQDAKGAAVQQQQQIQPTTTKSKPGRLAGRPRAPKQEPRPGHGDSGAD